MGTQKHLDEVSCFTIPQGILVYKNLCLASYLRDTFPAIKALTYLNTMRIEMTEVSMYHKYEILCLHLYQALDGILYRHECASSRPCNWSVYMTAYVSNLNISVIWKSLCTKWMGTLYYCKPYWSGNIFRLECTVDGTPSQIPTLSANDADSMTDGRTGGRTRSCTPLPWSHVRIWLNSA